MFDFSGSIPIGCDHAGYFLKQYLIEKLGKEGYHFDDKGTFSEASVDYPDFIHPVAKAINEGRYSMGIIICGSGNGVSMVANKYAHVRAALCWNAEVVKLARQHNDANILALPARFITPEEAIEFVKIFFSTGFEGGRHAGRVEKIIPREL
ncbi:MAG: ribose 5-phosphate isomerase B [Syntrophothermus sp.]